MKTDMETKSTHIFIHEAKKERDKRCWCDMIGDMAISDDDTPAINQQHEWPEMAPGPVREGRSAR